MSCEKECKLGKTYCCMDCPSNDICREKRKNRKPQYYCLGYENRMTDEPYKECMECPGWDLEEQCQKDYRDSRLN